MGRIHKVSRQIVCGANRLARFSTRIHFVWQSSTSEVWKTCVEGKIGKSSLPSFLRRPGPGCLTKTVSCKFELVPARTPRVFEETFTDRLWRLVRYVEDSLNSTVTVVLSFGSNADQDLDVSLSTVSWTFYPKVTLKKFSRGDLKPDGDIRRLTWRGDPLSLWGRSGSIQIMLDTNVL